jgi:hypothetical protein
LTNPGDVAPSLSLSVSPAGEAEAASIGQRGSLWFSNSWGRTWHRTRLGGTGTAYSEPSLRAGSSGTAALAVEGPGHSLLYYSLARGKWQHIRIAGPGSAYSTPSLGFGPRGAGIAVDGPRRSLRFYALVHGAWRRFRVVGATLFAPALGFNLPDQARQLGGAAVWFAGRDGGVVGSSPYSSGQFPYAPVAFAANTTFQSAPSLSCLAGTHPVCLYAIEAASNALWVNDGFSATQPWQTLPSGTANSAPSVSGISGRIDVATLGPGNSVLVTSFTSSGWTGTTAVPGQAAFSAPALVVRAARPAGEVDLLVQGADHSLWYYSAAGPWPLSFTGTQIAGPGTTFGG